MAGWQSGHAAACKAVYAGSIPASASIEFIMRIGVIGYGFVGKAFTNALKDNCNHFIVDPILNTNIAQLNEFKPDINFICLPTPENSDGTCNAEIVINVLQELKDKKFNSINVIKSTITPDVISDLSEIDKKFIYNPEFLTERNADFDFINSNLIVLGGNKEEQKIISKFYTQHTKCIQEDHIFTSRHEASFLKYTINSFLASKVTFFNELYLLFSKFNKDMDWDNFIKLVQMDPRIGSSHMKVPGNNGNYVYGGNCFPKDTKAFLEFSRSLDNELYLLKNVININKSIRDKYNKP